MDFDLDTEFAKYFSRLPSITPGRGHMEWEISDGIGVGGFSSGGRDEFIGYKMGLKIIDFGIGVDGNNYSGLMGTDESQRGSRGISQKFANQIFGNQ